MMRSCDLAASCTSEICTHKGEHEETGRCNPPSRRGGVCAVVYDPLMVNFFEWVNQDNRLYEVSKYFNEVFNG